MRIISVSGACSRAGKTALAATLLRALGPGRAAAIKFTTTEEVFERCPRGTACIVCDIDVPFRIVEEARILDEAGTDTRRLGEAGARRVLWAIARASAVGAAWAEVRRRLEGEPLAVMEGSTIVHTAHPDLTAFVVHPFLALERWKPGSDALIAAADEVVVNLPGAETRPPSAAVSARLRELRGPRGVRIADVARPLAEWGGDLGARVQALAGLGAPAPAAAARPGEGAA